MTYDRFDDHITQKYGVVVRNWPLKEFCNPSSVGSRIELETLYNGWQSGVTRFEKLTKEEMMRWEKERFLSRLTVMSVEPAGSSPPPPFLMPLAQPTSSNPDAPPLLATPSAQPTRTDSSSPQLSAIGAHTTHDPIISNTPSLLQQTPDPELISSMILLDPSLQNIDPVLLAASAPRQPQTSTITTATVVPTPSINLPTPAGHSKRNREAFQVITAQSYGTTSKRPRKERKGRSSNKSPAQGSENVPPDTTVHA